VERSEEVQAELRVDRSVVEGGRMVVGGRVEVSFAMPGQGRDLPAALEAAIEAAGQEYKRKLFREVIERADRDVVLERREGRGGKGLQLRGQRQYTFKTVFGTVQVGRSQVAHKADGAKEIPSATVWETPRGVCITAGLREAVCDGMLEQSAEGTVERVEERSGEAELVAKSTVLKIVEEEGDQLREAQRKRAEAVLAADREAEVLTGGCGSEEALDESDGEVEEEPGSEAEEPTPLLGFPGRNGRPSR
jgi:hypothetical protein